MDLYSTNEKQLKYIEKKESMIRNCVAYHESK